jgi:predicted transcriptional regulator
MSTTTIRIEDDLKERVAAAAERAGKTSHAFIVEAIAQTVEQAELEAELHRVADERWSKLKDTGLAVSWEASKAYLTGRPAGERARKPRPRKLGR